MVWRWAMGDGMSSWNGRSTSEDEGNNWRWKHHQLIGHIDTSSAIHSTIAFRGCTNVSNQLCRRSKENNGIPNGRILNDNIDRISALYSLIFPAIRSWRQFVGDGECVCMCVCVRACFSLLLFLISHTLAIYYIYISKDENEYGVRDNIRIDYNCNPLTRRRENGTSIHAYMSDMQCTCTVEETLVAKEKTAMEQTRKKKT